MKRLVVCEQGEGEIMVAEVSLHVYVRQMVLINKQGVYITSHPLPLEVLYEDDLSCTTFRFLEFNT
jgi:hypothetical protein